MNKLAKIIVVGVRKRIRSDDGGNLAMPGKVNSFESESIKRASISQVFSWQELYPLPSVIDKVSIVR